MTTGNNPLHLVVPTSNPVAMPTDDQLFELALEKDSSLSAEDFQQILKFHPDTREALTEIFSLREEEKAKQRETEKVGVINSLAEKLKKDLRREKYARTHRPKGEEVEYLSREKIVEKLSNQVLEDAKAENPELFPPWVYTQRDLAALRGYLCGERKKILAKIKASQDEKYLSWAREAATIMQRDIDTVTRIGKFAFQVDLTKEETYCEQKLYNSFYKPKFIEFGYYRRFLRKPEPTEAQSQGGAEGAAAVRQRAEQLFTDQKVRQEIGGRLIGADCDERSAVNRTDRIMRKFRGSAVERLTQAAIGQGVLARTCVDQQASDQAGQSAELYAKAAGLPADEFELLLSEHLKNNSASAEKSFAKVEKPLSASQARQIAEQARRAREAKKQAKGERQKKNKK